MASDAALGSLKAYDWFWEAYWTENGRDVSRRFSENERKAKEARLVAEERLPNLRRSGSRGFKIAPSSLAVSEAFRLCTAAERLTNGSKNESRPRRLFPRIGRSCFTVPQNLSQVVLVSLQIHCKRFGPLPFAIPSIAGFLCHG